MSMAFNGGNFNPLPHFKSMNLIDGGFTVSYFVTEARQIIQISPWDKKNASTRFKNFGGIEC